MPRPKHALPEPGQRFHFLAFVRLIRQNEKTAGMTAHPYGVFICGRPGCGKECIKSIWKVTHGKIKSCGCGQAIPGVKRPQTAERLRKEEAGKVFGTKRVIRQATDEERNGRKGAFWLVECELCGTQSIVKGQYLRRALPCICVTKDDRAERLTIDLTGKRFHFLEALRVATPAEKSASTWHCKKSTYWLCKCHHNGCGNEKAFPSKALRYLQVKTCGCLSRDIGREKAANRVNNKFVKAKPAVILGEHKERPIVLGNVKPALGLAQYHVVKAILDAPSFGLNKDELVRESGHTDARKVLARLAESDPDWKAVIHFPGEKGQRYRIG